MAKAARPRFRHVAPRPQAPDRYPAGAARQLYAIQIAADRTRALSAVRVPALVIHGTNDPLIPDAGGRATARAIDGARLLLIDRMGHTLPPDVWARVIDAGPM